MLNKIENKVLNIYFNFQLRHRPTIYLCLVMLRAEKKNVEEKGLTDQDYRTTIRIIRDGWNAKMTTT